MSLRSAVAHRNLLYLLSLKELRTRYKKSVLGWAWSLLNPLVADGRSSRSSSCTCSRQTPPIGDPSGLKNFPLYFLCGLLPFNFFSICVGVSIGAVQGGAGLIKKVQFPHEHLVFSVIVAQFVTLLIELARADRGAADRRQHGAAVAAGAADRDRSCWRCSPPASRWCSAAANVFYHDVNYLWASSSRSCSTRRRSSTTRRRSSSSRCEVIANYGPTGSFIIAVHNVMYDLRMPSLGRLVQLIVARRSARSSSVRGSSTGCRRASRRRCEPCTTIVALEVEHVTKTFRLHREKTNSLKQLIAGKRPQPVRRVHRAQRRHVRRQARARCSASSARTARASRRC